MLLGKYRRSFETDNLKIVKSKVFNSLAFSLLICFSYLR